ncbi:hypothetical protein [Pelagibius sp.]|uniref:hypothetical protein n=1 Tax=Pelagibius sp. TaxID=1931238 RepID=UPI002608A06B|nr:hypothetical protein [Pelagibius sp.]
MVAAIPGAEQGFTVIFSDRPFPGHQAAFEWRREEYEGNWYYVPDLNMEDQRQPTFRGHSNVVNVLWPFGKEARASSTNLQDNTNLQTAIG